MAVRKPAILRTDGQLERLQAGDALYPFFPLTPAVDADFAWANQGTASMVVGDNVITLVAPTADALRMRTRAVPATPYTIRAALSLNMGLSSAFGTGWCFAGLFWRESGSGKVVTWALAGLAGDIYLCYDKWNSSTVFASSYFETKHNPAGLCPLSWLEIADDGTHQKVSMSADGLEWIEIRGDVTSNNFLTPDQVGFFVNANNCPAELSVYSWQ